MQKAEESPQTWPGALRMIALPLSLYTGLFVAMTGPLITRFRNHIFVYMQDGLQNVWNLWWVRHAVVDLGQSPWHTDVLHFPYGVTLLGHTLNPFNGFLGILLQGFLSLNQTFNFLVVFAFVIGAYTAFLLAYRLTGAVGPSLIAGAIYSFSSYHFAHLHGGHLQLISLQWIPLFVLCFYNLLEKPRLHWSLAAALCLLLVMLCDYYYLFFCILAGLWMAIWKTIKERRPLLLIAKSHFLPVSVFCLLAIVFCGPLIVSLLLANRADPLIGAHPALQYSLDLTAIALPGTTVRLGAWFKDWLPAFRAGPYETSSLGLALFILIGIVIRKRKQMPGLSLLLWLPMLLFFWVMSLGPRLHVWGEVYSSIVLPYAAFAAVFPPLKMGGVPVRMMIMVILCAAILAAFSFAWLLAKPDRKTVAVVALLGLMALEHFPAAMPAIRMETPPWVRAIKALPKGLGVIDTKSSMTPSLYYQTIHEKPLAGGYVSRIPRNVLEKEIDIAKALRNGEFYTLRCRYNIGYWVTDATGKQEASPTGYDIRYWAHAHDLMGLHDHPKIELIFEDAQVKIFAIEPKTDCECET